MISNDERTSVYNFSTSLLPSMIEKSIKDNFTDKIAMDFIERQNSLRAFYECSTLSVYSTEYKRGQYVLLPYSTNTNPLFGKVVKLLCCDKGKYGYLYYQKTKSSYSKDIDVFMVVDKDEFDIIATMQLAYFHPLEVKSDRKDMLPSLE